MKQTAKWFGLLGGVLALAAAITAQAAGDALENGFRQPPASARPWVYWFPLSGNLTREGITADLEAMARVGIGGVLYMEVDQGAPKGPADFAGPRWRDLFRHACSEAARLGLQINMNNDAGWCGSGGPWITPELSMQKVVWSEMVIEGGNRFEGALAKPPAVNNFYRDIAVMAMPVPENDTYRVKDIAAKASFVPNNFALQPASFPDAPPGAAISRDSIMDISVSMDATGRLAWDAPAGKWLVMRFGHTTTGKDNHPAPESGRGLECDKFSKEAAAAHYQGLMAKVIADNRPLAGRAKVLVSTHIDSWEVGSQNWTPQMREEFRNRRGYDLWRFLPAFAGRVIDSTDVTERFLYDLRQTVSDLIIENYAGEFRRLANQDGLRLSIEAYDGAPVDEMTYGGQADEPMAEFWSWDKFGAAYSCTEMASSAHIYGKQILGAEAFTANDKEKWQGHPAKIKELGDWAFCEGINRFVFHRYAAQPWTNVAPGMSMGPWGLHYERTQTWWEQSKPWHEYLARCQYLLQQGSFVADVLCLQAEGAPRRFTPPSDLNIAPHIRGGYNYDGCTPEALFTRVSVKDGRLVLPDGMNYRVLVLPETETMTPHLLRRIKELVDAGATVIGGTKPPKKSPILADLGPGDAEVKKLAAELWPRLFAGKTAAEVLASRGVKPDFESTIKLRHIHRTIGHVEIYFVANPNPYPIESIATFRIAGKQPELWWPDTGCTAQLTAFEEKDGVSSMPLQLEPSGSVFVVFRNPSANADPLVSVLRNGQELIRKASRPVKIVVEKARYGVLGDPHRTRDCKAKVQALVDAGNTTFPVVDMAKGDDPAYQTVKTLLIDYRVDDKVLTVSATDSETISLNPSGQMEAPPFDFARGEIWQSGDYIFTRASGKARRLKATLPKAQEISGAWEVAFDPNWGGPAKATFDTLEDWSKRPENGIKYYSGTAKYRKNFRFKPSSKARRYYLDLGDVAVMAGVKLNGNNFGILWKPPYRIDVTEALRRGDNLLELSVVNLWCNRQIGDEQLPEDSERNANGTLKLWPQWLGKPSPAGRFTFSSWRLWKKNDPLVESGLLGPVKIYATRKVGVEP